MSQGVITRASIETSRRIRFTLRTLRAREGVSQLYRYDLSVTGSVGLDIDRLLGMDVSVRIDQPGRHGRYFHGVVDQAGAGPTSGKSGLYELVLVPAVFQLARCGRQRVHTDVSLPELVEARLEQHGLALENRLNNAYPPHELVVQYNESDLDFVLRLLEQAGIFFTFEHSAEGHRLVMWDDPNGLPAWTHYDHHPFIAETGQGEGLLSLMTWAKSRVRRIELDDVDPRQPGIELTAAAGVVRRGESCAVREEYPGGYNDLALGRARAATRLQAERAHHWSVKGVAASRGVVAGYRFAVHGHPEFADQTALVATETDTCIEAGPPTAAGSKLVVAEMHTELIATALDQPLPLPAVARRPKLRGPHTARVDGPAADQVHVDESGRVQVRFPWQDENDPSPWVRVSQAWAGPGRGSLVLPRVGDEVLVSFEHGDARRPIIVGALYNGDAQPPLPLPAGKTQTLLQTRSLAGTVENRLRIDDTDGAELMATEAGRDYRLSVDNDAFIEVGHHLAETVAGDRITTVDGDQTSTVDGVATVSLGQDLSVVVDRKAALHSAKAMTVTSDDTLTVSADRRILITGRQAIKIENDKASIELQADGDVIIRGERVTIRANGRLTLKGSDVIEQEG